jgi:serine/threonine protein kinase
MIGTQVGSYRIDEKIGSGGMGTVYRGMEVNLDRVVAIKVLHPELAGKPHIVERFRTEAKAQANLNHTNVAILYAFLIHEGSAMMVMEYVDGENFQQLVKRRGPVPSSETIPLFKQALNGVGAAHRMGIVHRDIKPGNIMVNKLGVVKVMDFGIAKLVGDRGLTRTGVQVGTVYYMSPEQIKSQPVDARTDIYALGVTLYELLTARVPFPGESEFEVLTDHVNTLPALPSVHHPGIPRGVANIVLKALEKKPEDRFQTVEEFAAALDHPEAWENYVSKSVVVVPPGMAPTVEMEGGQWASNSSTQTIGIDSKITLAPKPPRTFWSPTRVGIASFIVVLAIGAIYLLTSGKPLHTALVALNPTQVARTTPPVDVPGALKKSDANPAPVDSAAAPVPPVPKETSKPAPGRYVIPAKTMIEIRLTAPLDSSLAVAGQIFSARVNSPILVDGETIIPNDAETAVRLTKLTKAAKSKPAKLEFELANLSADGQRYAVKSDRIEISGDGSARRSGKFLGIGSVSDPSLGGKTKLAKPAGEGDAGNNAFVVTPETPLSFKLRAPVPVTIRP